MLTYQTKEVDVPEPLKQAGYIGKASVVVDGSEGNYSIRVQADFGEGVDPLDLLPTTDVEPDKDKAIRRAEAMIGDISNWLSYK